MDSIAVIYKSKYGHTKKYARWIAEELDASFLEVSQIKPEHLAVFDVVIYGGGLYAGGINGVSLVSKNPCKKLVVFTVGLANPDHTDYSEVLKRNFPGGAPLAGTKVFRLRGGIIYNDLGLLHKGMMAVFNKAAAKKNPAKMSREEKAIVETGGKNTDFTDRSTILPLVEHVRELLGGA